MSIFTKPASGRYSSRPYLSARQFFLFCLAVVLIPAFSAQATKYYVSSALGSNANSVTDAQSSSTPWQTLAFAISQASANDQIVVLPGTYSETNVLINKSLEILGNETGGVPGTGIKPVFDGVSPTADGYILRPAASDILIKNLEMRINQVTTTRGIFSPAGGFNRLRIEDNAIFSTRSPITSIFGSYGIQLGQLSSAAGLDSVVIVRNVVRPINNTSSGFGHCIRLVGAYGRIGSADPADSNQVAGDYAIQWGGSKRKMQVLNNRLYGVSGALETVIPAAGNTHIFMGNVLKPAPGFDALMLLEIKNNTLANSVILVENNQLIGHQRVGLFSERSRNVFVRNNVFIPSATSSDFIHIAVNTKQQSAGNDAATFSSIHIKSNQFLGGAGFSGTGVLFQNHASGVYPPFQNTEVGGPGAETNQFASPLRYHFMLDTCAGLSSHNFFWVFSGSSVSLMRPVSQNFDFQQNLHDVGSGLKLPGAMTISELLNLEDKIAHGVDYDSLGFVTVVPKKVFVTPQSFISTVTNDPSLQRAIKQVGTNNDWTMHARAGFYPGSSTVTTDLVLDVENTGGTLTTQKLTMNAPGKILTVQDNAGIDNELALNNGLIDIQSTNLSMNGLGSVSGGSAASYVRTLGTGMFRYSSLGNTLMLYPVGSSDHYFPMSLLNAGLADNIGLRVQNDVLANGLSGAPVNGVVKATWILDEANLGGSNLTALTSWNGSDEKPGFTRGSTAIQGYNGSAWMEISNSPIAATGSDPYSATYMNISANLNMLPIRIGNAYTIPPPQCTFKVVCHQQGLTHGGTAVPAVRSDLTKAEVAQKSDVNGAINFYSLGFGGYITLKSSCAVKDGPGNDIKIWETTYGTQLVNSYSDRARVYASQDGINFQYLGTATFDGAFDLNTVGLSWAQYFRIADATVDSPSNAASADAFDVDGIEVLNGYTNDAIPEVTVTGGAATVCGGEQGKTKNFNGIAAIRSDQTKATGLPENNDTYNFYALGFGGTICLKFDFAVFDGPGGELKVVETTFGNTSCNAYKERAEVAVSFDGVNWNVLGEYCQDYNGTIDIGAANSGIQYVRVRDVSLRSDFTSPSADGYDLDAVVATSILTGTPPCPSLGGGETRIAADYNLFDQTTVPDEIEALQLITNPVAEQINLRFSMVAETATLSIYNQMGQKISAQMVEGKLWDLKEISIPASQLATGVYFISLHSGVQKETIKFVKQ